MFLWREKNPASTNLTGYHIFFKLMFYIIIHRKYFNKRLVYMIIIDDNSDGCWETIFKNEVFLHLGSVRPYATVRSFSLISAC